MSGISYDACRQGVNQPLGTGSTLPLHILFLNVDRQQRRAEPEVWQEQRWNEAERRTEIRRGPGWLTQSRMTHKYRQSETLLLSGPRWASDCTATWLTLHPASPGHQRLPLAAWWDCPRSASSAVCSDRKNNFQDFCSWFLVICLIVCSTRSQLLYTTCL